MAAIPSSNADPMLQTLSQIYASVQRMDKVVNGMSRSLSAMETKLTRLQRAVARIDTVPDAPAPVANDAGPDKRMTFLRNVWGVHIDRHLKEERGLFMDGNSARDEMFNIFKQTNLPDGAMTFQEQKALAMWVTSSLKTWRRKDLIKQCKRTFSKQLEDARLDISTMSKQEYINRAIAFVENEIVFKHGLMEKPSSNVSVLRSGQIPSNYKRFICTVVHNLLPKDYLPFLPKTLSRKDADRNGEEVEQPENLSDEEGEANDLNDEMPTRKTAAKRVNRHNPEESEIDLLVTETPKKRKK